MIIWLKWKFFRFARHPFKFVKHENTTPKFIGMSLGVWVLLGSMHNLLHVKSRVAISTSRFITCKCRWSNDYSWCTMHQLSMLCFFWLVSKLTMNVSHFTMCQKGGCLWQLRSCLYGLISIEGLGNLRRCWREVILYGW